MACTKKRKVQAQPALPALEVFFAWEALARVATAAGVAAARQQAVAAAAPVIARAARITHWVVEDARSARAFLERVRRMVPLALPLQQQAIDVLPRAPKGRSPDRPPSIEPLLAPALEGHELGLLSEAGLPALADPGTPLVAAAHAAAGQIDLDVGKPKLARGVELHAVADHVHFDTRADQDKAVMSAIDFVGLSHRANRRGSDLSTEERHLGEIAKALIGKPKLVMLDEPGAGMSESESKHLVRVIRDIPAYTKAQVFLIDHDVALISACCHETMVLDFGKLLALGPTLSVLKDPEVQRAYLGSFDELEAA